MYTTAFQDPILSYHPGKRKVMSRWRIVAWAISAKKLLLTTLPLIIFCQKGNKEVCNVPLFVNPTDSVHYALFKLIVKWHEQISHLEISTS